MSTHDDRRSRPCVLRSHRADARRVQAGADIVVANHTNFDGSKTKLPQLGTLKPNQKNPYVIGKEGVLQYLTVVDECAKAGSAMQQ